MGTQRARGEEEGDALHVHLRVCAGIPDCVWITRKSSHAQTL